MRPATGKTKTTAGCTWLCISCESWHLGSATDFCLYKGNYIRPTFSESSSTEVFCLLPGLCFSLFSTKEMYMSYT